ncbi:hypothetical protein HID58_058811 [Brassica napus]|uniref:Uncharacterized protein n=1 Tax=Brassica napus TaxID=3708 RepID=A0ABQ7ZRU5_BRANA|nr:hypothetical protein HID58_058811 [Brassica napus]
MRDTTRLISMNFEVLEHSKSRYTVTTFKSERFKGRRNFLMWLLADGTFEIDFNVLSNLSKIAHHLLDVAFIQCSRLLMTTCEY